METQTRKSTLRITTLALINVVAFIGFVVLPAFSIEGRVEPSCGEASLWTDVGIDVQEALSPGTKSNVILIMLDGVRWQEIIERHNAPIFAHMHATLSNRAHIFTNDRVSNPYRISLPAYQSIFAGAAQRCSNNDCGRIVTETFPERIARELKLHPKKVATIAS